MPRSKSLSHYPSRYGEIIEACAVRGESVSVPYSSLLAATKIRGHFYAYIGALRREGREIEARRGASPGDLETLDRAAQSHMVLLTIEEREGIPMLVFQNRENSWQAKSLESAVFHKAPGKPTATSLADIEARLAATQQAADKTHK